MRGLAVLGFVALLVTTSACGKSESPEPTSAADQALVTKARAIVKAVDEARWQDARKDFDANMRKKLPSGALAVSWATYRKEFGDFRSQGDAEVVDSAGFKVVNIDLDMSKKDGQARVSFDEDGMVAGLFFLKTGVPVP